MQIIGHRGAAGLAPENTIASIQTALDCGVDWIEFDVRRTKDGHIILIHDPHTGRVASSKLQVRRSDMSDLQALSMTRGQPLPSLEEAIQCIGKRAKINIEIKDPSCAQQVVDTVRTYAQDKGFGYKHFMVSSFSPAALRATYKADRHIPLALLQIWPTRFLWIRSVKLTAVGFYAPTITTGLAVKLAKKRGLTTYTWSINDPRDIPRLQKLGIDRIVTDYPNRFKELPRTEPVPSRQAKAKAESAPSPPDTA